MRYYPNLWGDRFFRDFFEDDSDFERMACDIKESEQGYQLVMNLPGFNKEDITMDYEDGYLTIKAVHKETSDIDGRWIRQERHLGSYQRSFYMGRDLDESRIHASYNNGVLTVDVPKTPAVTTKKSIMIE